MIEKVLHRASGYGYRGEVNRKCTGKNPLGERVLGWFGKVAPRGSGKQRLSVTVVKVVVGGGRASRRLVEGVFFIFSFYISDGLL